MSLTEHTLRIGVVEDGMPLSSLWRLWRRGGDTYIAARSMASFKSSLHRSGKFRHAFVTDQASERFRPKGADRAVLKWNHPTGRALGAAVLYQIIIPESELLAPSFEYPLPKKMVKLSRPPKGSAIYITILKSSPGVEVQAPAADDPRVQLITVWASEGFSTIWILAHAQEMSDENQNAILALRADLVRRFPTDAFRKTLSTPRTNLRAFAITDPHDGIGRVVDVSAEFLLKQ